MLYKKLQALFHPERYHGWGKNKKYFEGWYYKVLTADEKHAWISGEKVYVAVTAGENCFLGASISVTASETKHLVVFITDGKIINFGVKDLLTIDSVKNSLTTNPFLGSFS